MNLFTFLTTLLVFGLSAVLCTKKWLKRRRTINMMNRIPGPPALPILGNTLKFLIDPKGMIPVLEYYTSEFGPIVRYLTIVVNMCMISKAEYVETILNNTVEIKKSVPYKFLVPWLGTGLLTGTGPKWFAHRKLLTPSFHFSILETFIDTFNEKSKILENRLRLIPSGTVFNMEPYIKLCTLDIICKAVMGINMNTQVDSHEKNEKTEYISGLYEVTEATVTRLFKPWLYPDWIFYNLSPEGKKYADGLKRLHDFSNKVVRDKIASRKLTNGQKLETTEEVSGMKKKQAFLDLLLEASEKEGMLPIEEVREEVDTFMFEGHDTTTSAITWAVFLLGNHPEIQNKVFQELDLIFQSKERKITSADLKEMKYLERVIKETLRLYPSVPFFDRTLINDLQLGEYLVPAGVDIRIAPYLMHRSSEYFEKPNTFNPDNFLPEKVKNRHPFAYVPFSAGPRNCIGQKFAMMELKTILATMFLNFRIESVKKVEDVAPIGDLILRPLSGLKVKLYPRSQKII